MLLAPAVREGLDGSWDSPEEKARWFRVGANLDNFVQGGLISVAEHAFKAKAALLAQLDPPRDEVWEVRCCDPKPGIRVFGRFALKDVFVGLRWEYRVNMKGRHAHEWHWMIDDCQKDWDKLFPSYQPVSGVFPDDYLSDSFHLI